MIIIKDLCIGNNVYYLYVKEIVIKYWIYFVNEIF